MKVIKILNQLTKCLLLIIFLLTNRSTLAQGWQWAKSGGGGGNDYGKVSCVDPSGNIYIGGTFDSPSFTLGSIFINNGGTDVFIAKYNASGILLWSRSFGGSANETISAMCTDASGNLYVSGNFSSASVIIGTVSPITNSGSTDVYIACYNSSGSVFWARKEGGAGADDVGGIAHTGTLIVAGNFDGASLTIGTTTLANSSSLTTDLFVAKYTSSGSPISAIRAGGIGSEIVTDMVADASANLYLSGYFSGTASFGSIVLTSLGNTDAFALKLNSANAWQWGRSAGGTSNDVGNGISVDASLNVFLTGSFASGNLTLGTFTLNTSATAVGVDNGFVSKYNSSGTIQWANLIGSNSVAQGLDVENDNSGNTYVGTRYASISSLTSRANVYMYNSSGLFQWLASGSPNGSGTGAANHISIDNNGNIYVTGQLPTSGMTLGTTTLTSAGQSDPFVAKIACISPTITGNSNICSGLTTTLTISGASSYTWNTGSNNTSLVITPTASTTYSAVGYSSVCGVANSNIFYVNLLPSSVSAGTNLNLLCKQKAVISASCSPSATLISWSPGTNLSSSTVLNPTVTAGLPITYTLSATLSNGCQNTSTVSVSTFAQKPDICMVTVDSLGNNNEIYFDKTIYPQADSFIVYRETSSNIYTRIGAVSRTAYSMYTDTNRSIGPANGNPNLTSYKYKIAIKDSCGNLSLKSLWHQTVFIQDQLNGNFNWSPYAIESSTTTPVSIYNLKRRNLTTGTETLVASTTAFLSTDPQYNTIWPTQTKWFVDAVGFNCNATTKVMVLKTKTKSNQSNDKQFVTNIGSLAFDKLIEVYPNPAHDVLNINMNALDKTETDIQIINMLGQVVYETKSLNQHLVANLSEFKQGVYMINIKQNNRLIAIKKVVIQ